MSVAAKAVETFSFWLGMSTLPTAETAVAANG
jgi:hypothetical protein